MFYFFRENFLPPSFFLGKLKPSIWFFNKDLWTVGIKNNQERVLYPPSLAQGPPLSKVHPPIGPPFFAPPFFGLLAKWRKSGVQGAPCPRRTPDRTAVFLKIFLHRAAPWTRGGGYIFRQTSRGHKFYPLPIGQHVLGLECSLGYQNSTIYRKV